MNLAVEKGTGDNTKQYEGKTAKAIYEFDGKKLKWFASEPGRDQRPGAFPKEGEDSKGMYVVFEREKK
jgi:uncharacterized protein (TIGR03067 family)